jgi:HlyD family secretion protein
MIESGSMTRKRKLVLGIVIVLLLALAAVIGVLRAQDRGIEVRVEEVRERDLVATITATGSVRARRQVNISSDVQGRVIQLNVEEGDEVEREQVLLRIDPSQLEAQTARARASLSQSMADVAQRRANLLRAQRDLERNQGLRDRDPGLISRQALEDSETEVEVQQALLESAEHGVEQARAAMAEAEDQLGRTTIRAPISGRVTRLDIEEGETVVVGTMNNPGSLLLTISDLSVVEAVMAVDETDVPRVSIGDSARVELDAFPGREFSATVAKIGNSAIRNQAGGTTPQGTSVDYEVILTLLDPPMELRPDLSATADIVVDAATGAVATPIISVTVRDVADPEAEDGDGEPEEKEGVFVVRDGQAHFQPVELGLTGQDYFQVTSGLSVGDMVISGPFQSIQSLQDGDAVRLPTPPSSSD